MLKVAGTSWPFFDFMRVMGCDGQSKFINQTTDFYRFGKRRTFLLCVAAIE